MRRRGVGEEGAVCTSAAKMAMTAFRGMMDRTRKADFVGVGLQIPCSEKRGICLYFVGIEMQAASVGHGSAALENLRMKRSSRFER